MGTRLQPRARRPGWVGRLEAPHEHAAFYTAYLRLRHLRRPATPPFETNSLDRLLVSVAWEFPRVTLHRERINPDVCHIGRIMEVAERSVTLLEIGPDARWDQELTIYRFADITRVDCGGGYEKALGLVGGDFRKVHPDSMVARAAPRTRSQR